MRRRALLLFLLGFGVLSAAGAGAGTSAGESGKAKPRAVRLQAFGSCGDLLEYAKRHATRLVGPWGLGGAGSVARPAAGTPPPPAAPPPSPAPGVDYSTTNVQEAGIDEPDVVKTNGSYVFAVAQGKLHAIDVRSGRPRLVDSVELSGGWSHELLVHGRRLLVISRGARWIEPLPRVPSSSVPHGQPGTFLASIDVSDPADLRIEQTLELDAWYLTARLAGGTARLVVNSSVPDELEFVPPETGDPQATAVATERNRAVIASSGLSSWLPTYALENRRTGTRTEKMLALCRQVRRPVQFSGLGMTTVLTIDLDEGLQPVDSDAVMTDAQIVYASDRSLIVATQRWDGRPDPATGEQPARTKTALHRFGIISRSQTIYRASGEVPGTLLNQWSLSEHDGALRVASTEFPLWWTPGRGQESESFVSVLRERDGRLVSVGRVGELGRGERIYAVRFAGEVGYVVTFRQVDPLYTIDLSDPEKPRVLGELKILGYSAYLHPVDEELVLGLGQDATEQGRLLGSQLSLFDVGNLRTPERLHRRTIGPGSSEAEYDHHAFLYWRPSRLVVVPVHTYSVMARGSNGSSFVGAIALRVGRGSGFDELGRIVHRQTVDQGDGPPVEVPVAIRRSLVVGPTLYTYSEAGLKANNLRTLAATGWVEFPRPPVVPGPIDPPPPVPGTPRSSDPSDR